MAEPELAPRKPRIRKSAPTFREVAEKQSSGEAGPKKQRQSGLGGALKRPFAKATKPENELTRAIVRLLRPIGKVLNWLVPRYFVNSWRELKLVTWPGRRETWRLTGAVFVFAIVFGLMITVVDKAIDRIFKEIILK